MKTEINKMIKAYRAGMLSKLELYGMVDKLLKEKKVKPETYDAMEKHVEKMAN